MNAFFQLIEKYIRKGKVFWDPISKKIKRKDEPKQVKTKKDTKSKTEQE